MRIPGLHWDKRHNVAVLTVSYSHRVWNRREIGDILLGYSAPGRLCRVVLLNAADLVSDDDSLPDVISRVMDRLRRTGGLQHSDLAVLRSALNRARSTAHH
jgi:hypothetical protein